MRSNRLNLEHGVMLERDTIAVWLEVEVSQKNITRYLATKEQLSIFQNHVKLYIVRLLGYSVVILFKSFYVDHI